MSCGIEDDTECEDAVLDVARLLLALLFSVLFITSAQPSPCPSLPAWFLLSRVGLFERDLTISPFLAVSL